MLTTENPSPDKLSPEDATILLRHELIAFYEQMGASMSKEYKSFYDRCKKRAESAGSAERLLAMFIQHVGCGDTDLSVGFLWRALSNSGRLNDLVQERDAFLEWIHGGD